MAELHTPFGGHFGRDKTLALTRRLVWWPGLPATVEEYIRSCPICQRVNADHLPPAGPLYPLPVPTRRGGYISLDFIELPVALSGHDFLQVRIWLVPSFETATPETAARSFVSSVFRGVGLPDVCSSRTATRPSRAPSGLACARPSARRLSSARRISTAPPARWSAWTVPSLMSGAPLRPAAAATGRTSCHSPSSPSATRRRRPSTPTAVGRGHPRRPLNPPASPDPATPAGPGEAAAHLMGRVTAGVRALLRARQGQRNLNAELDAHRRGVLLDSEHTT